MIQIARALKMHLRHQSTLVREAWGEKARYARVCDSNTGQFPYVWADCNTPIKIRDGFPDINENRLHNMELTAALLDSLIIGPGEIFRFWKLVPRPSARSNFKEGPSLVRGRLETDFGGGLCQISTTLFGAFLEADLDILERSNHSIDAHGENRFFRLGRDAAVAFGYKDLAVKNIHTTPLRVVVAVSRVQREVVVTLSGNVPLDHEVRLTSEITGEIPPETPSQVPGKIVTTTRQVRRKEEDWTTNYESTDYYRPHISTH